MRYDLAPLEGITGPLYRRMHHEIYLSDVRKAAPERWRTVIRQPVREK